jgi:glycosyltransferase involved in cell wall biosynthesis
MHMTVRIGAPPRLMLGIATAEAGTFSLQANGGLADARNTGIRAARAEFVLPLDGDDLILPPFLADAMALLRRNNATNLVIANLKVRETPAVANSPLTALAPRSATLPKQSPFCGHVVGRCVGDVAAGAVEEGVGLGWGQLGQWA